MNRLETLTADVELDQTQPAIGNGSPTPPLRDIKANILIVDDRPDKLMAVEAILSSLGENILKARSGKEALRHLLHEEVAVILLDVSMPCMDGFETAALIRDEIQKLEEKSRKKK